MTDVHSPEARQRNMAAIRATDTQPELAVRRGLHAFGYRFRLHVRVLPGRPDIVLPRHRVVVFVHGCFFHGHNCPTFRWPTTRAAFWRNKITSNQARDVRNAAELRRMGWRVLTIWECSLRGPSSNRVRAIESVANWISRGDKIGNIRPSTRRIK